jgi:hypothetical protein
VSNLWTENEILDVRVNILSFSLFKTGYNLWHDVSEEIILELRIKTHVCVFMDLCFFTFYLLLRHSPLLRKDAVPVFSHKHSMQMWVGVDKRPTAKLYLLFLL